VSDVNIVSTFPVLLESFSPCFNAPSFVSFVTLMSGWVLNLGRHTVTGAVRAAGAVGLKHISAYHRFFSKAWWRMDQVGLVLARLIISQLLEHKAPIVLIVDDTLGRHTGKKIAGASMHRDPLLSTAKRARFHWGHVWVVLSIEVECFKRRWALPVLFRLHRTKKRCQAEGRAYRKTTEQARALMLLICETFPNRTFRLVGDAAYTNSSLIKNRPENVTIFGRARLDAALYAPVPKLRGAQRGRPRVRGKRLACPEQQVASNPQGFEQLVIDA